MHVINRGSRRRIVQEREQIHVNRALVVYREENEVRPDAEALRQAGVRCRPGKCGKPPPSLGDFDGLVLTGGTDVDPGLLLARPGIRKRKIPTKSAMTSASPRFCGGTGARFACARNLPRTAVAERISWRRSSSAHGYGRPASRCQGTRDSRSYDPDRDRQPALFDCDISANGR